MSDFLLRIHSFDVREATELVFFTYDERTEEQEEGLAHYSLAASFPPFPSAFRSSRGPDEKPRRWKEKAVEAAAAIEQEGGREQLE